jgi:hypothetical protein
VLNESGILPPIVFDAEDTRKGGITVFLGDRRLFSLGHYLMVRQAALGEAVVAIEGANVFDLSLVTRLAGGTLRDRRKVLEKIHLSRAFTVHQLEAVIRRRLKEAMIRHGSRRGLVSGFLDPFRDEEVPVWEASRILKRTMHHLKELAEEGNRIIVLAPDPNPPIPERKELLDLLKKSADRVFTLPRSPWVGHSLRLPCW